MTRDPRYYKGHEHCAADLEESKFWRSEAKRIRDIVQRTQFNRNILMWLVGNELETPIDAERGSDCLWQPDPLWSMTANAEDESNTMAAKVKEASWRKVAKVADICPQIDVLGTNIYGNDIRDVGARLREAGWTKPWAVFLAVLPLPKSVVSALGRQPGFLDMWPVKTQVPQTSWGAPVEPPRAECEKQSSTAKGQFLKRALQLCIDDDACLAARQPVLRVLSFEYIAPGPDVHSVSEDMCVAFMVFLWGWKWEKTATWFGLLNEWPGGNAPVQGHQEAVTCYLNDIGQPLYDMFAPIDKTSFRIHVEKFLVDSDKAVPLGFTAHRGAEVQLDLHAATHCTGEQDAWANWFVTRESLVSPKSDGNIAEEPQTVIEHVVEACEPGSFRAKLKTSMLEEGNYRLYGFARRTQDGAILGYPSTVEASISIPFHIGKEKCADVKKGRCFDEVTRLMTSARRMGYASWPLDLQGIRRYLPSETAS
ncbi:CAT1 [Symbiodinium natans]|uniref:CAT1 protein n=1 Tax=Symbiodinium natans TaxID=878477 RepID=A0A812QZX2_9DINO|nr:CAT1 [Symbiodinium natans]